MEQASGEYHKEGSPSEDALGLPSIGTMPDLSPRPSDSVRQDELRTQLRSLQADHTEPEDPLSSPGAI